MLNEISTTITLTGEVGTAWESEQLEINGYTFQSVDGATSGLFTVEDIVRNYVYSKNVVPFDPLLRTREQFAKQSNFVAYTNKATQAKWDEFIDISNTNRNLFCVISSQSDAFIFTTDGTYINVVDGVITSDGYMLSCEPNGIIRNRGINVDWKIYPPVILHEKYER